jgi:hypothetical protein
MVSVAHLDVRDRPERQARSKGFVETIPRGGAAGVLPVDRVRPIGS